MDGSYATQLRIWEPDLPSPIEDLFGPPGTGFVRSKINGTSCQNLAEEFAQQLFACESLTRTPRTTCQEFDGAPYSLQWFLTIESHRYGRAARWIPRMLEFGRHQGEVLLGLGQGLGTDWIQYARNGAKVIICSSAATQLDLVRRNFQLRGLRGTFVHAAPDQLPLERASVDVVCINGLLEQLKTPSTVVDEVFRVLKPGGKVIAVTPAKYNAEFMRRLLSIWHWLPRRRPIENDAHPMHFSARRLRRLFNGFEIHRISKRQLQRSDLPWWLRLMPITPLERFIGSVLVIKAFKPISTAIAGRAAA